MVGCDDQKGLPGPSSSFPKLLGAGVALSRFQYTQCTGQPFSFPMSKVPSTSQSASELGQVGLLVQRGRKHSSSPFKQQGIGVPVNCWQAP